MLIRPTVSIILRGILCAALCGSLSLLSAYADSQHTLPTQQLPFYPDEANRLTIITDNNQIYLRHEQGKKQVLISDTRSIPEHVYDIWLADFNFDNHLDIAIAIAEDEDGINEVYQLFVWDHEQARVKPMPKLSQLSNPDLLVKQEVLKTISRSSHHWRETLYRFNQGKPYVYARIDMLSHNLWHTQVYSKEGKKLLSRIAKEGGLTAAPKPIILPIMSDQAWLYAKPLPSTKTKQFLHRNEEVTILDYHKSSNQLDWVLVRSHGKAPVESWTLLSNINNQG